MNLKEPKSIFLDQETVFHHHLSENKEKIDIYNNGILTGKIRYFDETTRKRLSKLYYGMYSGLIYMYAFPTDFNNIGNKIELLTYALDNKNYKIIHGETDSTREIPFFMYANINHLDSASWIEVDDGITTWVYDPFSLLQIEKGTFYKLEHPTVKREITKDLIESHPRREDDDYSFHHDGGDLVLLTVFPQLEKYLPHHPFRDILAPELDRYKKDIDYDSISLREEEEIFGKRY